MTTPETREHPAAGTAPEPTAPRLLRIWVLGALVVALAQSTAVAWETLADARGPGPRVLTSALLDELRGTLTPDDRWAIEQEGQVVCLQMGDRRATDLHLTLQLELAPALSVCSLVDADVVIEARGGVATGWRRP